MKEIILKSFAYNAFIEIKDSLMAKVYAFFFVREYRHRVITSAFIFGLSLFFMLDTFIINGSKLSVPGILAFCCLATFALYCVIFNRAGSLKQWLKNKLPKKAPKEAQK